MDAALLRNQFSKVDFHVPNEGKNVLAAHKPLSWLLFLQLKK
jgi:hypothetical protein